MYVSINGVGNNKSVYIQQSYRKSNGKTSSRIIRRLGRYDELLARFDNDEEKMREWARGEAEKENEEYRAKTKSISLSLSPTQSIPKDITRSFNAGYLFLQQLCTDIDIKRITRNIRNRHKCTYDIGAILTDLVYARLLSPASKRSSYEYCKTLLEPPKYDLQQVYRALFILAGECDYIQSEIYKSSNFAVPRDKSILYYDCTNYYFEIEQEDDFRKYGKSKENRPNPIVGMGLFMDTDGIPLAFDLFPGNQNEQTTLRPLEKKIIRDFDCSKFIFCSDSGLGSKSNRLFNSFGERSYVITYSLKKMKAEERRTAMDPKQFRRVGSNEFVDISKLDEADPGISDAVFYKEIPLVTESLDETLIVTYSPKYKAYQRALRDRQVQRAKDAIAKKMRIRRGKNQNDPMRFVKKTAVTPDGEIAEKNLYALDSERIAREAEYDGFYAVVTNLEGDIRQILDINRRRWKIEENFRIMKSEFDARPIYVRREDRIRAHFLTCFLSLLIYRLLEIKLGYKYTCSEVLHTLRSMQMIRLDKDNVYIPGYTRTELTDGLHEIFGFHTDREITTRAAMRSIIKNTKEKTKK